MVLFLSFFLFFLTRALLSFASSIGAPAFNELSAVLVPVMECNTGAVSVDPSRGDECLEEDRGIPVPHHADRDVFGIVLCEVAIGQAEVSKE
jgi:uncharacterized membrane protein